METLDAVELTTAALERDNHDLRQECAKLADRFKQQHQRLLAVQEQYDRLASRSGRSAEPPPGSIPTLADLDLPDKESSNDLGPDAFNAALNRPHRDPVNLPQVYQQGYGRAGLANTAVGHLNQGRSHIAAGHGTTLITCSPIRRLTNRTQVPCQ
jgi:hypothetical protein